MSAPILWILIPFISGILILFFLRERYSPLAGGAISTILALIALIFPIDTALLLGSISIKISASDSILWAQFCAYHSRWSIARHHLWVGRIMVLWHTGIWHSQPFRFTGINDRGAINRIHCSGAIPVCRASA